MSNAREEAGLRSARRWLDAHRKSQAGGVQEGDLLAYVAPVLELTDELIREADAHRATGAGPYDGWPGLLRRAADAIRTLLARGDIQKDALYLANVALIDQVEQADGVGHKWMEYATKWSRENADLRARAAPPAEQFREAFTAGWNAGALERDRAGSFVAMSVPSDEVVDSKVAAQLAVRAIVRTLLPKET